jgi:hypothetical protein
LPCVIGRLSCVVKKICKITIVVDLHHSFLDTTQLPRTHLLAVIEFITMSVM